MFDQINIAINVTNLLVLNLNFEVYFAFLTTK